MDTHASLGESILGVLAIAACIGLVAGLLTTNHTHAQGTQDTEKTSPLVMRVAVFPADQGRLDDYRDFVEGHLFPTLRAVPGYVGAFLGRDPRNGQLISISFARSEADMVAAEEAVRRTIRSLPPGSAPRPSKVEIYGVQYRDINGSLAKQ